MLILSANLVTAVLSTIVYTLVLKPLAVPEPQELVATAQAVTGPEFDHLQDMNLRERGPFNGLFAWGGGDGNSNVVTMGRANSSHQVGYALVSGNTADVLHLATSQGRWLGPTDDVDGGGPGGWKCVISSAGWRSLFSGDPSLIGTHIKVNGVSVEVVGIQSAMFSSPKATEHPVLYLPLAFVDVYVPGRSFAIRHNTNADWLTVYGRLKKGGTRQQAAAFLNYALRRSYDEYSHRPGSEELSLYSAGSGDQVLAHQYGNELLVVVGLGIMMTASCGVACSLLITGRLLRHRKATAIRMALGATRGSLVVEAMSPFIPILCASVIVPVYSYTRVANAILLLLLHAQSHIDPRLSVGGSTHFDLSLVAYSSAVAAVAVAILASILFGVAMTNVNSPLQVLHASSHGGTQKSKVGFQMLVAAETFVAAAIVVCALTAIDTVIHFASRSRGIDAHNVQVWPVMNAKKVMKVDAASNSRAVMQILATMRTALGNKAVAAAFYPLLQGVEAQATVISDAGEEQHFLVNYVSDAYFTTLGQSMLRGSDFPLARVMGPLVPCIVNARGAETIGVQYTSALSDTVRLRNVAIGAITECQVTGVVENAPFSSMREELKPTIYLPLIGKETPDSFIVYSRGNPERIRMAIAEVRKVQGLRATEAATTSLQTEVADQLGRERALAWVGGTFGITAIAISLLSAFLIAASGIHARNREIAIRLALGASRKHIVRLLCGGFLVTPLLGNASGVFLAYVLLRKFGSLLVYSNTQLHVIVVATFFGLSAVVVGALLKLITRGSRPHIAVQLLHDV